MSWLYLHPIKDSYECIEKLKVLFPRLNHYQDLKWTKAPVASLLSYTLTGIDPDHRLKYLTNPEIFTAEPWKDLKGKELVLKTEHGSYIIESRDFKSRI